MNKNWPKDLIIMQKFYVLGNFLGVRKWQNSSSGSDKRFLFTSIFGFFPLGTWQDKILCASQFFCFITGWLLMSTNLHQNGAITYIKLFSWICLPSSSSSLELLCRLLSLTSKSMLFVKVLPNGAHSYEKHKYSVNFTGLHYK